MEKQVYISLPSSFVTDDTDHDSFEEDKNSFVSKINENNIIGNGTYSIVYAIDKKYAIKMLRDIYITPFDLTSEIDILFSLSHSNILKGCGMFYHEKQIGFILERSFCNLNDILKYNVPDEILKDIFGQVLLGVGYLHDNGYLHLDLTLKNILLSKIDVFGDNLELTPGNYQIKIADFSLSSKIVNGGVYTEDEKITTDYRPPENISGSQMFTDKSDVWSLGIIFHSLIIGKQFIDTISRSTHINNDKNEIDWALTIISHIRKMKNKKLWPPSKSSMINSMLNFDKEYRPSINEIIKLYYPLKYSQIKNNVKVRKTFVNVIDNYDSEEIKDFDPVDDVEIKKISDSMFNRCQDFFELYDYESINPDIYDWYTCCYCIAFRLFYSYSTIKFVSEKIFKLEQYIFLFLHGKLIS